MFSRQIFEPKKQVLSPRTFAAIGEEVLPLPIHCVIEKIADKSVPVWKGHLAFAAEFIFRHLPFVLDLQSEINQIRWG